MSSKLPLSVAVEQMVTAGEPEVARRTHPAAPSSRLSRSKCSTGPSSSPTISRNSKALACPTPLRGRNVRNTSRIVPLSWLRVTATSTPGGWSQSDAAKFVSSSAARRAVARSGAPNRATRCAASISTISLRSVSSASTICTSVERPSEVSPRKPARNAVRALPLGRPDRNRAKANAPDTAHSPGSAGFSKTNLSDASSRMVRSSFTCRVLLRSDRAEDPLDERPHFQPRNGLSPGCDGCPPACSDVGLFNAIEYILSRELRPVAARSKMASDYKKL